MDGLKKDGSPVPQKINEFAIAAKYFEMRESNRPRRFSDVYKVNILVFEAGVKYLSIVLGENRTFRLPPDRSN